LLKAAARHAKSTTLLRQAYFGDRLFRAGFRLPFEAVADAVFLTRGAFFFAATVLSSASISREACSQ